MLRIRDVYPGSLIRIFFPSRIPGQKDSGSRIRTKDLSIFNPKNCFSALGNMIRDVHPGSRSWFITHPGSRGQKGTGSRIRIRNSDYISIIKSAQIKTDKGPQCKLKWLQTSHRLEKILTIIVCQFWSIEKKITNCLSLKKTWDIINKCLNEMAEENR
jgi:hypothetical protein